jgi:hypothetical protein
MSAAGALPGFSARITALTKVHALFTYNIDCITCIPTATQIKPAATLQVMLATA